MKHDDAAAVLLVRAVEEVLPDAIPPELLLDAHIAAGDPNEGAPWIARRARYLIDHRLAPYAVVLSRIQSPARAGFFIAFATAAGLAANYLGPTDKIHVIWNPMVILIAWNAVVYAALAARAALVHPAETRDSASSTLPFRRRAANLHSYRPSLVERVILGPALTWMLGVKAEADEMRQHARGLRKVAQRFAALWWPQMRPIVRLWLRRTLHLSAIGIAVGAILGMYVRGLFFDYNVAWESTFIRDPETVALILRYVLGPAAIVLGQPLPTAESVAPLFSPAGDYAAVWIHLYAVSAVLFIVIPRGFLALAATSRLRHQRRDVKLNLQTSYYAQVLEKGRNVRPKELEARVRNAVRDECLGVGDQLAEFVCSELYDARITARLNRFRETGGTLRQLEDDIRIECRSFGPQLQQRMSEAGEELERRVAARIKQLLGENEKVAMRPVEGVFGELSDSSLIVSHTGDRVSGDFTTLVTTVVSGSVGIAVGTISGGFGETLGIALLVGLVESGPVGWIIGAIGGLVATFGVLALGRSRLRQGLKDVPLPAAVLRVALWTSRYEKLIADGRKKCDESVRNTLATHMDQFSSSVADQVWKRLRAIVGESQRPTSGVD
jgi:hypothetical protein